jgi:hypothetical protein
MWFWQSMDDGSVGESVPWTRPGKGWQMVRRTSGLFHVSSQLKWKVTTDTYWKRLI